MVHSHSKTTATSDIIRALSHTSLVDATTTQSSKCSTLPNQNLLQTSAATTAVATEDSNRPKPLFDSLIVILGDPTQPCIGKLNNTWNKEDFNTRRALITALQSLGYTFTDSHSIHILDAHNSLHASLKNLLLPASSSKKQLVFNLCDEGFNNNALQELHVPALLEMHGIAYTGAGPNCLAYCYDKGLVNRTADSLGVPTPKEVFYLSDIHGQSSSILDNVFQSRIQYPAFIKPIKGDNSLGITVRSLVHTSREMESYMQELNGIGIRDVIIQEYCSGTEYGVGMVGNLATGFYFLPILEVDYTKITNRGMVPILGFESKWDPESPYWSEIGYKQARLSDTVREELYRRCVVLWERFGCRDYARFDFRCDHGRGDGFEDIGERRGEIKLLEVNPNPGWCWDGKFAHMGKFEGKSYADILGMILKAAHDRVELEKQMVDKQMPKTT